MERELKNEKEQRQLAEKNLIEAIDRNQKYKKLIQEITKINESIQAAVDDGKNQVIAHAQKIQHLKKVMV